MATTRDSLEPTSGKSKPTAGNADPVVVSGITEAEKMTRAQSSNAPGSTKPDADVQLDEVRNILFGALAAEHNARFDVLEMQVNELRRTFEQSIESVRSAMSDRIDERFNDLDKRLQNTNDQQRTDVDQLRAELMAGSESLVEQLNTQIDGTQSAFNTAVASLNDAVSARFESVEHDIEQNRETGSQITEQLTQGKVDRSALATLFASLSQQIDLLAPPAPGNGADQSTNKAGHK